MSSQNRKPTKSVKEIINHILQEKNIDHFKNKNDLSDEAMCQLYGSFLRSTAKETSEQNFAYYLNSFSQNELIHSPYAPSDIN